MTALPPADGESLAEDFESLHGEAGLRLHVARSRRFKSTTVDLFLPRLLREQDNTRLAVVARLLERGTTHLPDLRQLNRYTDWLYGAGFLCQAEAHGPFQVLHLHYDAVDRVYLPATGEDLLEAGLRLLGDVVAAPRCEDGGFPPLWVEQEKQSLQRYVAGLRSDRTYHAQRRCLEIMCAGEPYGLSAHGDPADLPALSGGDLMEFHRTHTAKVPLDVYVCGDVDAARVAEQCRRLFCWPRAPEGQPVPSPHDGDGDVRIVVERDDVAQGRMVLGYRCAVALGGPQREGYPALALLNLILGGDVHSRLYQRVREDAGLCYHIASYTEPMGGMLFVEAGVEPGDREAVRAQVAEQLRQLRSHGPEALELARSRALALQRLDAYDDAREGLVRFHYYRQLAGTDVSRARLRQALCRVDVQAVRQVAAQLEFDTDYFLAPEECP